MSWLDQDNKTEKPTPKRREKARSEGSFAKSGDLNGAIVLTAASLMLLWFGGDLFFGLSEMMKNIFFHIGDTEIQTDSLRHYLILGIKSIAILLAPIILGITIAGVVANVGQVGFVYNTKLLAPKWSRLNPLGGIGRLFSPQSLVELGKSILKLTFVGVIGYFSIWGNLKEINFMSGVPTEVLVPQIGMLIGKIFLTLSLSMLIIGILDFLYSKYSYEKQLMMTKEEVKEEAKQAEGDPKIKSKIREIQFKTAYRRMMKKVPEADVIITNPIHLAVALKYDRTKDAAPIVVAKGARKVAERIKAIAKEHEIPIVENKPLARALFKTVEIGEQIPAELYKAVAEVLAYVYRLKNKYFGIA
jgi:flagellar biosynthetic protein FlhB